MATHYFLCIESGRSKIDALLENFLNNDMTYSRLWYLLSKAYYNKGNYQKAFKLINKSVKFFQDDYKLKNLRKEIKKKLKF